MNNSRQVLRKKIKKAIMNRICKERKRRLSSKKLLKGRNLMGKWYLVRRVRTRIMKKIRSFKINSKSSKENQAKSAIISMRNS